MYRIRKLFRFEAAHQLCAAESDCCKACIHGHSYRVEVFLKTKTLNAAGMVIDFGQVKTWIQPVIDEWDHALFLPPSLVQEYTGTPSKKIIPFITNPTAETMARALFDHLEALLAEFYGRQKGGRVQVEKIRVHETETGWAEYEADVVTK